MAKHARPQGESQQDAPQAADGTAQAPLPAADSVRGSERYTKARKRRSKRKVLSTVLIVVGVALLLVAGGMYAYQQWQYHESDRINDELATYVTITEAQVEGEEGGCPVTVDWDALKAVNPEVVGWLYIPDTTINYAVYQHADNEYYLHHNAEGEYTVGGQLFLDMDNTAPGLRDPQTLIYGHHLQNGTMFEQIATLDQQENFDAMGTIWYVTEEQAFELAPVFMYDTDRDDVAARTTQFASADEVHAFFAERLAGALTRRDDADQVVASAEHFLTLSTCVYYSKYAQGHGRGLVVCVPVSELVAAIPAAQ